MKGGISRAIPAKLAQRRGSQHGGRRHLEPSYADPHVPWRGSGQANPPGDPIRRIRHYHHFKCPSLSAVPHAKGILSAISKVPARTNPEKLNAMPSATETAAML